MVAYFLFYIKSCVRFFVHYVCYHIDNQGGKIMFLFNFRCKGNFDLFTKEDTKEKELLGIECIKYNILNNLDNAEFIISNFKTNTLDILAMGYHIDTYYGSDQWKVNNNQAAPYNYVYFPNSTSLYLAGEYNPVYIRHIRSYNDFYFGTLNHK